MTTEEKQRFGIIVLIGCPNAGKSTLLNSVIGSKVSIVSPKVQTTRSVIRGIYVHDDAQIVFIDTPGIFAPQKDLERRIVRNAWSGIREAESGLLVIDASVGINDEFMAIIKRLDSKELSFYGVINKIDLVSEEKLKKLRDQLQEMRLFKKIYEVSSFGKTDAQKNSVTVMMQDLEQTISPGHWHFDEDEITDAPNKFLASEITREQIFLKLHKELPYSSGVQTELFTEQKDGSLKINQVIYVAKDSHKSIVLGARGSMIKVIGERARLEIGEVFGCTVHLFLFVKVKENWFRDIDNLMIS